MCVCVRRVGIRECETTTTYVCVYILWERMDVRREFYLCKKKKKDPCYIEDFGGIITYWSRHA